MAARLFEGELYIAMSCTRMIISSLSYLLIKKHELSKCILKSINKNIIMYSSTNHASLITNS